MSDESFLANEAGLRQAIDALLTPQRSPTESVLPHAMPEQGLGEEAVLKLFAPLVIGGAAKLGTATAFAHMDPPTPWITWATSMWNASLNQNLLHADLAPVASELELRVFEWLSPFFGMTGGHMTPGSTVANLTAMWAARESRGIRRIVASEAAHISVAKSANLLGLEFESLKTDEQGRLVQPTGDLSDAALVRIAGTTNAGAIDDLKAETNAAWVHVDAAWAGPLRLSRRYRERLDGIERADSVAVSGHKWLFQPKESAMVFFRDADAAHDAISFGGAYLSTPNIGVLGSHGASGINLLATLYAWGREGTEQRIDATMGMANRLADFLLTQPSAQLFSSNVSGVLLWRSSAFPDSRELIARLPDGAASHTSMDGHSWVRHVAANPNADIDRIIEAIGKEFS